MREEGSEWREGEGKGRGWTAEWNNLMYNLQVERVVAHQVSRDKKDDGEEQTGEAFESRL